mmetsp:Transcript_68335/g.192710  ORF Transcript_68335/g.192710 Transcript_68335/m.192710 type:complete len:218 (-) Transcript_68335:1086-1739(-)
MPHGGAIPDLARASTSAAIPGELARSMLPLASAVSPFLSDRSISLQICACGVLGRSHRYVLRSFWLLLMPSGSPDATMTMEQDDTSFSYTAASERSFDSLTLPHTLAHSRSMASKYLVRPSRSPVRRCASRTRSTACIAFPRAGASWSARLASPQPLCWREAVSRASKRNAFASSYSPNLSRVHATACASAPVSGLCWPSVLRKSLWDSRKHFRAFR